MSRRTRRIANPAGRRKRLVVLTAPPVSWRALLARMARCVRRAAIDTLDGWRRALNCHILERIATEAANAADRDEASHMDGSEQFKRQAEFDKLPLLSALTGWPQTTNSSRGRAGSWRI